MCGTGNIFPKVGNKFFEKLQTDLSVVLEGTDFDHSFTCKWTDIEEAISRAQGSDGQAKCLSAYLIEETTIMGGKLIEGTLDGLKQPSTKHSTPKIRNMLMTMVWSNMIDK